MQIESFWQGQHKASKKPYFHCGPLSGASSKNTKYKKNNNKNKTEKDVIRA